LPQDEDSGEGVIREPPPRKTPPKRGPGRPRKVTTENVNEKAAKLNLLPPNAEEWHDYISNVALKWGTRGYVAFATRGLDRYDNFSKADLAALDADADELAAISKPISHMAERSKFGKRYGRTIIDSTDGVAAIVAIGMWGARVNRIANKYRKGMQENVSNPIESRPTGSEIPTESSEDSTESLGDVRQFSPRGFGYN